MTGARTSTPGWPIAASLLALIIAVAAAPAVSQSLKLSAAFASGSFVLSFWLAAKSFTNRWLNMGSAYIFLLGLFHTGLLIPIALGVPVTLFNPRDGRWLFGDSASVAATIYTQAQLMLTLCLLVGRQLVTFRSRPVASLGDMRALNIGLPVLVGGVGLWLLNVLRSGATVLGGSYSSFLTETKGTTMPAAYLMMGFGLALAAASASLWTRRIALAIFLLWAGPAFLLGLRGEVILPAAVYGVVAARRQATFAMRWLLVLMPTVLAGGSVVRAVRGGGFSSANLSWGMFSPLDGLAELGYSIRPLITVINWHEAGEQHVGISTYLAPFARIIGGRILGLDVPSAAEDPSVLTTVVSARVGNIGGSPLAEAFRAGGTPAVLLLAAVLGVVLATLDGWAPSQRSNAIVGMIGFALFLWVRNDFTPAAVELAIIVAVGALMAASQTRRNRDLTDNEARSSRWET